MVRKQFAVIGLGRFGSSVAVTLSQLGHDVLAIDSNEHSVQSIMNQVTHAVQGDAREEETLKALGIRNFEVVIVAIGDDIQANILITLMLKEMGVKMVVSKAMNPLHGKVLEKIGADKIIYPEKDMGIRLAYNLVSQNVMDLIELSPDYSVVEIAVPSKFVSRTLGDLDIRAKYGISVIAIKRTDSLIIAPGANERFEHNDIIIIISKNELLAKLPI